LYVPSFESTQTILLSRESYEIPVRPVLIRQVVLMLLKLGVGLGNFTFSSPPSGIILQFVKDILNKESKKNINKSIESSSLIRAYR